MSDASSVRICFRLVFDGAPYCGWQIQDESKPGKASIQGTLEKTLSLFLRQQDTRFPVFGCGRTDAGFHAEEYFCHVDLPTALYQNVPSLEKLRHGLNCLLPDTIAITTARLAPGFRALDDVDSKIYEYRILVRRSKPVLLRDRCCWLPLEPERFDNQKLQEALKMIEGTHDFKAFMAAHSSARTTVRTLRRCVFWKKNLGDEAWAGALIGIEFEGEGFLKHMVRNLAGTLIEIAVGKRDLESLRSLLGELGSLDPGLRQEAGFCAPAEGLFLKKVLYRRET